MSPSATVGALRAAVIPVGVAAPPGPAGRRAAAVLLLIDPEDDSLPLLFMLRAETLRLHAGQISFPGGSVEASDSDVVATALREAAEEVGVDPANVEVIGTLDPLLTAVSNIWLTPVVGLQRAPWTVVTDGYEVAECFTVGIADLMTAPHEVRRMTRDGVSRDVHFYETQGRTIWGVTGAVVHDLLTRLGHAG